MNARILRRLLLATIVTSIALPILPAQAKPPLDLAIKRQQFRNEYVRFETVIDALDITAGMTILDIGAGPGYASFLFAGKLHGSGEVFATDIRKDFVGRIADEAKKRGLTNLYSVVVNEKGLDEFYGRHRYDLVFLSNVYHCLEDRIGYFGKLRGFLKPGARLVVVLYNQVPLFSVEDLSDLDSIADSLSDEADDDPFYEHLSAGTRRLLEDRTDREGLAGALVADFNRMLTDPRFYRGFYDNSYFRKDLFDPPERDFANWLLMTLHEDGVPEKAADQIDARAMRGVIKLNRLFFAKRFGDSLARDGMGAYLPAGDANRHTSKYVMLRELDAAGYEFNKEIKLSPFFDAVVLVPKAP
jgi:SAM-dependent methyltransferase